ncbi:MFS transporter [Cupriavidus taiwanensis]|uniref:MFS transporter n=1 Tax=Cupriavidus taiwanensis TaxID=164546 RepID=UPI000E119657|nr:MFS transporter [Cupriavidus taiwanensis]SOZ29795.1 putative transporter [Cupriavidus taiwanensis]SPA34553.1 putative transporter [Cupriavidus taiwanensis]
MNQNSYIYEASMNALERKRPTRQRLFLVSILFVGISIAYLDRVNIAVIAANAQFLADMGIAGQPVKVGLMMSLFLGAYGISNVVLSPLGDYLGPRRGMVVAYLIICASLLVGGMASTFGILLGTRVLLGIGEGLYYPMQNTIVKNWFPPKERGRANTAWLIGQSLAPAAAMPVFTYLVAAHSWEATFHFSFAISLVPLLLLWFFTADSPHAHKRVNEAELRYIEENMAGEKEGGKGAVPEGERFLRRAKIYASDYRFWMLLLILASNSILSWGVATWLPTYLSKERGFSWHAMGWISSLPFILGFVFKLAAGMIIDRTGRNAPVIALAALLCAAGVYLGVTIQDNHTAAVLLAFGIGASSAQIPGVFTLLQQLVPQAAMSSAAGTLNGIAVGFGALSPVLIGLSISMTRNFGSALYFIMGIVLFGGVLATILSAKGL